MMAAINDFGVEPGRRGGRVQRFGDSWNKTDKNDPRTMVKAPWMQVVGGEIVLPVVQKSILAIREPRRLFAQDRDLNVHICMPKNRVQSLVGANGC